MKNVNILLCAACIASVMAVPTIERASDTTTVLLGQCEGVPQLYSQGVLYGVNGTTPPQSYITDLGINYLSEGGAQIDSSSAGNGYSVSMASYTRRFNQLLESYQRMREVGGVTIAKMADIYGGDETQPSTWAYPGDNGDWTKWDAFLQQFISDLKANQMTSSYVLQLEPWNEPDINFGGRPQSQFNELWRRTVVTLRSTFPSSGSSFLPIVGPSTAGNPGSANTWWNSFLSSIKANGGRSVQPDVWNWHMEGGLPNDPIPPAKNLPAYVQQYGLTTGIGLQNNEFGVREQQRPGWSAWFKARYERLHFNALRGNWARGSALLDNLADLLIHNADGSYSTTGEYQVYKFYKEMSGSPCSTTSGSSIDSFATAKTNSVTALVGSKSFAGTWTVSFTEISKYFGGAASLKADIIYLPYSGGGAVTGWTTQSTQTVTVSGDATTVTIDVGSGDDAYAIHLYT